MNIKSFKTILVEKKNDVIYLTLNRPEKRNAINNVLVQELKQIFTDIENDPHSKVVILQGAGDNFCSGADLEYLKDLKKFSYEENYKDSKSLGELFLKIYEFPKPVIAKVYGSALAGGCGLCTVCDFIIAEENSSFGYPEVKIGFIAAIVSSFLIRQIGERKARELLLTGQILNAKEALSLGLINKVLSNYEIDSYIEDIIITLKSNSSQALKMTKSILNTYSFIPPYLDLERLSKINALFRKEDDFSEGINSFLEKRKPKWNR